MKHKRFLLGGAVIFVMHLVFAVLYQFIIFQSSNFDNLNQNLELLRFGVLAGFLLTMGIYIWEMRLFTRKTNNIRIYAQDFLPCLLQTVLLSGLETASAILLYKKPQLTGTPVNWQPAIGFQWCFECVLTLILCALVTFVTGASRTMLYHDEKRK